ncbi:hypothetical protein PanWU01x14_049290 [Parasponia andersonii]|uniref:DUF936 domain-containing protein n=1 Tax=Parasponia andersonii TaxID=3476 RepID=A0A2P5DMK9_PARAD|nr:hypothetical protein PanWU01x14_049290 [Parasponia andersonii]
MADEATARLFFRSSRSDLRSLKPTAMTMTIHGGAEHDLDFVYNDEIRLGQFVYVTRLNSATLVPILRG